MPGDVGNTRDEFVWRRARARVPIGSVHLSARLEHRLSELLSAITAADARGCALEGTQQHRRSRVEVEGCRWHATPRLHTPRRRKVPVIPCRCAAVSNPRCRSCALSARTALRFLQREVPEWGQSRVRVGSEWGQSGVRVGSDPGQTPTALAAPPRSRTSDRTGRCVRWPRSGSARSRLTHAASSADRSSRG